MPFKILGVIQNSTRTPLHLILNAFKVVRQRQESYAVASLAYISCWFDPRHARRFRSLKRHNKCALQELSQRIDTRSSHDADEVRTWRQLFLIQLGVVYPVKTMPQSR
jgi:hypothetical protein